MGNFGGWAISRDIYDWITNNIVPGSTILEFGSGTGSYELSKKYKVTCIEHDTAWLNKFEGINYIHCPIKRKYYDLSKVDFSNQRFEVVIIDGPPRSHGDRRLMMNFIDKFDISRSAIIVDDVNRKPELQLYTTLLQKLNKKGTIYHQDRKSYAIIL